MKMKPSIVYYIYLVLLFQNSNPQYIKALHYTDTEYTCTCQQSHENLITTNSDAKYSERN